MIRLLEATARAERDHFWFRGFRRFVEPLVADAASAASLAILDCGCGTGHNLTWLRRYGRAVGIDLTWAGLQFARQRGERLMACATASQLPFPSDRFDLVTSFDVHLRARRRDRTPGDRRNGSACSSPGGAWSSTSQHSTCSEETTLFFRAKYAVTAGGTCGGVCRRRDLLSDE